MENALDGVAAARRLRRALSAVSELVSNLEA
jgi:hypothetical protein